MKEIWRDIKGYNGYYQVSNYGRVKSLDRYVNAPQNGGNRLMKGKILNNKNTMRGYRFVNLSMSSNVKSKKIHRLVAETFIPNPNNKPCINHIDGKKQNNHYTNLEWCTYQENAQHAFKIGLIDKKKMGKSRMKKVLMFDLNDNYIMEFDSIKSASQYLNKKTTSSIIETCQGKHKHAYGYKWKYKQMGGSIR